MSHCHTLLSAILSLQAYAVQGQHAIPQPDVSEGPSVSDPIYLQLRSGEAIPPSYFIPLDIFFPPCSPSHSHHCLRHTFHLTVPKIIDSNPNMNILKQNHGSHFSFHDFMISTHYHNHHLHKGNISVLKFIFSVS